MSIAAGQSVPSASHRAGRWVRGMLWVMAVVLLLRGGYRIADGLVRVWTEDTDCDLRTRSEEYALFGEGFYPDQGVDPAPEGMKACHSVYPPYAFPMMAVFFEPGGLDQGRVVLGVLSLAALAVIVIHAHRTLRPADPSVAAAGAAAIIAIGGNRAAFDLGQFSVLCVGLVVLQVVLLARRRPVAAGACWALAMLKPHVAISFGLLFLLPRNIRGLFVGLGMLLGLSWLSCLWTDVDIPTLFDRWTRGMSLAFSSNGVGTGPGALADRLGIDHRTALYIAIASLFAAALPMVFLVRRLGPDALLPLAGLCSGVGMLAFYHRYYDQIMLAPAVVAALVVAATTRRPFAIAIAAAITLAVTAPNTYVRSSLAYEGLIAAIVVAASVYPLVHLMATARRRNPACP